MTNSAAKTLKKMMPSSKVHKLIAAVVALAFVAAMATAVWAYTQPTNKLVREGDIATAVSDGTLVNTGSCTWGSNKILTRARLVACIQNNGACAGSTYYMPKWQDVLNCRVGTLLTTLSLNGTAYGATSCNLTCSSGGGSASSRVDYTVSSSQTATVNNATYPISWNINRGSDASSTCNVTVSVGGTAVISNQPIVPGGNLSGSFTAGVTGTVTVTATDATTAAGGSTNALPCTITGVSVTFYH